MPARPSPWFRAVGVGALVFILTVLVMVAALFTDPETAINRWLNRYALYLLLAEVGALLVLAAVAMTTDATKDEEPGTKDNEQRTTDS
jgi:threonine/homoserine/homoserine lactone efflux protein